MILLFSFLKISLIIHIRSIQYYFRNKWFWNFTILNHFFFLKLQFDISNSETSLDNSSFSFSLFIYSSFQFRTLLSYTVSNN